MSDLPQNINFSERMLVESLNREGTRAPFHPIKITDLNPGRRYKVVCIRSVHTRYGVKPICDLDTGESIYLPAKYAKAITREDLTRLNVSARYMYMTYLGHERDQWRTPILRFSTGDSDPDQSSSSSSAASLTVDGGGGTGGGGNSAGASCL